MKLKKEMTFGELLFGKEEHKTQMKRVRQGKDDGILHIKFKGKRFLLVGDLKSGAITERKNYENFKISYAHLFSDGKVRRFCEIIGTKEDIEVLEKR